MYFCTENICYLLFGLSFGDIVPSDLDPRSEECLNYSCHWQTKQVTDFLGNCEKNEQIVNLSNPEKPHLYVKKKCEIVSLELEHKREITCIIWHGCLV